MRDESIIKYIISNCLAEQDMAVGVYLSVIFTLYLALLASYFITDLLSHSSKLQPGEARQMRGAGK